MTRRRVGIVLAVAAAVVAVAGTATSRPARAEVATVDVTIRHSRFEPARLEVHRGTTVRFRVTNRDPIDHELIVGSRSMQLRHERGTDSHHDGSHGAVSVPAGGRGVTTHRFDEPGVTLLGCHLPGHWDYGMRGTVTVHA